MAQTRRRLLVMRHAKSDWVGGLADRQRPLAERGRRDASAAGVWLSASGIALEAAIVSPAARTQETWALVSDHLTSVVPKSIDEALYGADWIEMLDVARGLNPVFDCVVLVAHNPGSAELAQELAAGGSSEAIERISLGYPTLGTAVLEFAGDWGDLAPGSCELIDFVVPRG